MFSLRPSNAWQPTTTSTAQRLRKEEGTNTEGMFAAHKLNIAPDYAPPAP